MHKAGVTNKSNGLSQCPDHKEKVEFDNLGKTLLEPKLFNETKKIVWRPFVEVNKITMGEEMGPHQVFYIRATGWEGITMIDEDLKKQIEENKKDKWLLEILTKIKTLGPHSMKKGLQEWNDKEGLVLHRGKSIFLRTSNFVEKSSN